MRALTRGDEGGLLYKLLVQCTHEHEYFVAVTRNDVLDVQVSQEESLQYLRALHLCTWLVLRG